MLMNIVRRTSLATAVALAMLSVPAMAQDAGGEAEATPPIDVTFTLSAVSDYRFRGVSLSNKDPAFQPSITIAHESGFYAGVWGSNIAANAGSDLEVDLYAGFAGGDDTFSYDLGVTYYTYLGLSSANYVELIGKVGTHVGPVALGGLVGYVPSQDNTGNADNFYIGSNIGIPLGDTPLTLVGSVGLEDGAFASNKVDWTLGVNADVGGFTIGAAYVDTNRFAGGLGEAGALFSISRAF